MDQIYIQYRFTIQDPYGTFNDAIVLPRSDYDLLKQADIDSIKAARLASWKKAIDDAKLIPPPTKQEQLDEVIDDLAEINKKVTELTSQKTDLEAQIGGGK